MILTNSAAFPRYYVSPIHRLPEFVAGVAIGCIFSRGFRITKLNNTLFILSIASLFFISLASLPTWFIWTLLAFINLVMASACYHFVEDNKTIKSFILNWRRKPNSSLELS